MQYLVIVIVFQRIGENMGGTAAGVVNPDQTNEAKGIASDLAGKELADMVYGGITTKAQFIIRRGMKKALVGGDPIKCKLLISRVEEASDFNIKEFVESFIARMKENEYELDGFPAKNKAREMVFRELYRRYRFWEAYGYARQDISEIDKISREIEHRGLSLYR